MDLHTMQFIINNYSENLRSLAQIDSEMFENPVKFVMDLGEVRGCIQLALMNKLSADFAKRVFTDFHNLHKNDVINLNNLIISFGPRQLDFGPQD